MASILKNAGYVTEEAPSVSEAIRLMDQGSFDVIFTDLNMPESSGMSLVEHVNTLKEPPEIIIITAYASIDTAVKAIRLGAYDYLTKPIEQAELLRIAEKASEKKRQKQESRDFRSEMDKQIKADIIAKSHVMRDILETIPRIAASDSTVLIRGESGTGKEKFARMIHLLSTRSSRQMQSINCAAFPETLLESELFGYEKGAFTGANSRKIGIIEAASKSTLFLDEVADMPPSIQVKLLRVLQEKEIRRVGSTESIKVDFRLIAASNRPLEEMIRQGMFREDLFYRLNVIPIVLPPLRERKEDISTLIDYFIERRGQKRKFSEDALGILMKYPWPGNVRELEAVIERILVLSPNSLLGPNDIPNELKSSIAQGRGLEEGKFVLGDQGIVFDELEKDLLIQAMKKSNHVMADAAKLLGMTYRTFQYRAIKFGIRGN